MASVSLLVISWVSVEGRVFTFDFAADELRIVREFSMAVHMMFSAYQGLFQ